MGKHNLKILQNDDKLEKYIRPYNSKSYKFMFFDNLITVKELAIAFGLSPKTIQSWVYKRQIPYLKIGGKVLFRKRSLEEWLNRKEIRS